MADVIIPLVGKGPDRVYPQVTFPVDVNGDPAMGPGSNPLATQATATDANLTQADGVTNATAGVWSELLPANAARLGAYIQNRSAGNLFFKQANAAPSNGTQTGEIQIPPQPSSFKFDFRPLKRYFVRGDAASLPFTVAQW